MMFVFVSNKTFWDTVGRLNIIDLIRFYQILWYLNLLFDEFFWLHLVGYLRGLSWNPIFSHKIMRHLQKCINTVTKIFFTWLMTSKRTLRCCTYIWPKTGWCFKIFCEQSKLQIIFSCNLTIVHHTFTRHKLELL